MSDKVIVQSTCWCARRYNIKNYKFLFNFKNMEYGKVIFVDTDLLIELNVVAMDFENWLVFI